MISARGVSQLAALSMCKGKPSFTAAHWRSNANAFQVLKRYRVHVSKLHTYPSQDVQDQAWHSRYTFIGDETQESAAHGNSLENHSSMQKHEQLAPKVQIVDYEALMRMDKSALAVLRRAFVGDSAFGVVCVRGVPGYGESRQAMFDAAAKLGLGDAETREKIASVRQTFPGWNGVPGQEAHPLQSNFLHNIKEEVGNCQVDPYFGKNQWPDAEFKNKFISVNKKMYETSLQVMRGCDILVQEELGSAADGRMSNFEIAKNGTTLAGRFIMYDSKFSRDDVLLSQHGQERRPTAVEDYFDTLVRSNPIVVFSKAHCSYCANAIKLFETAGIASFKVIDLAHDEHGEAMLDLLLQRTGQKTVPNIFLDGQHIGGFEELQHIDLAALKSGSTIPTHTQPVPPNEAEQAGHGNDELASMRTHATAIRSSGHKEAGHASDGLASMRTHATAIRTTGLADMERSDGIFSSIRKNAKPAEVIGTEQAGHGNDELASMRTHATAIRTSGHKGAGHPGDGLASMRTHATAIRTNALPDMEHSGDGLASSRRRSKPAKIDPAEQAGHGNDELASMRTHATAIRTSGHKGAGHPGDGLASMRTHSTAIRTNGSSGMEHSGDGLVSIRKLVKPADMNGVEQAGHGNDELASMRTHATAIRTSGHKGAGHPGDSVCASGQGEGETHKNIEVSSSADTSEMGDYWLPWHIDSQFITLLTCDEFRDEMTGEIRSPPQEREKAGLIAMNKKGDIVSVADDLTEDSMLVQMGGFGQIYSGGVLTACRHAVLRQSAIPGITRMTYCNFWYAPWDLKCTLPHGRSEHEAINSGWNSMMDASYMDITMRKSFSAFRDYFTSIPVANERDAYHQPTSSFWQLSKALPLPSVLKPALPTSKIIVDVLTDIRCPFSHVALQRLAHAIDQLNAWDLVSFRYHPVFLNPDVPQEGEDLDTYLMREHGITPIQSRASDYPLTAMGRAVGVSFNPNRRVVNTMRAFCLIDIASREGKSHELFNELSNRYFEQAEDINSMAVLLAAAETVGMDIESLAERIERAQETVEFTHNSLYDKVPSIPKILFRYSSTGEGLELTGAQQITIYEETLSRVIHPQTSALAGVHYLMQPPGMRIPGYGGQEVLLSNAKPSSCVSLHTRARQNWFPYAWPYSETDFRREDESQDAHMYAEPRFVTHLDAGAIDSLSSTYFSMFGMAKTKLDRPLDYLDLCSSWISHYPAEFIDDASRVAVHGLNEKELAANSQATERLVQDLNLEPTLPYQSEAFDFVTMVSSVDYLTKPQDIFREVYRVLRPGGVALIAFSNRCFDNKAVAIWLREISTGAGLATIVADYIHFGAPKNRPWGHITSVDISPEMPDGTPAGDPMWVLVAVK